MINGKCPANGMRLWRRKWKMAVIIFIIFISSFSAFAQNSQVTWSSFAGGFGVSSSENSTVTSSAGIPFVGSTENGSSGIISGFLTNYSLLITDVKDEQEIIPTVYKLNQNYPNPFNPSTIINYQIPEEGFVTLKIYDILGKEVKTLVNENKPAGNYNIHFDASSASGGLASGIYIYRLTAGSFISTKKMTMIK
jgi:hypothetical protein